MSTHKQEAFESHVYPAFIGQNRKFNGSGPSLEQVTAGGKSGVQNLSNRPNKRIAAISILNL